MWIHLPSMLWPHYPILSQEIGSDGQGAILLKWLPWLPLATGVLGIGGILVNRLVSGVSKLPFMSFLRPRTCFLVKIALFRGQASELLALPTSIFIACIPYMRCKFVSNCHGHALLAAGQGSLSQYFHMPSSLFYYSCWL